MTTPRQSKSHQMNLKDFPEWTKEQLQEGFLLIKNLRYLPCPNIYGNKRRIPWLFIQNGCFARASLAQRILKEFNYPEIKKVFIFGNFKFNTKWTLSGKVTFKDHVAIGVRCESQIFILDPSVYYESPLPINDWIEILISYSKDKNVEFSVCNDITFSHNSNCYEKKSKNEFGIREVVVNNTTISYPLTLEYFTMEFLVYEYINLSKLGLNHNNYL
jgi:hypothetical protein